MSLWIDMIGAEVRYINTPTFGDTRIVEAGRGKPSALFLMHGIGGHVEAYAKNITALAEYYHVIAFDFVGHGLSAKKEDVEYTPAAYAEQLRELMDALGIEQAHLSGESLGGLVAGVFATLYPQRVLRAVLNTSGGIPIVSEKGRADLRALAELSAKNHGQMPSFDSVKARMQWLIYEGNWRLLNDELVNTRLHIYSQPGFQKVSPLIYRRMAQVTAGSAPPDLIDLNKVECETLLLWTRYNPIHDVAAAESALPGFKHGALYVMKADAGHWPQYEAPEEFNAVVHRFLETGKA